LDFDGRLSDDDEISSDFLVVDVMVSAGLFTIGLTDFSLDKLE
jgi:hypothetical protein